MASYSYDAGTVINSLLGGGGDVSSGYGLEKVVDFTMWCIIASILAVVGGILVYFLFVNTKQEPKNRFLKWLKGFLAFKIMWIEPLIKVFYYSGTIFCVLFSFSLISVNFMSFLEMFIVYPIALRLVYEGIMMMIMIWRNTRDIADNTKKK